MFTLQVEVDSPQERDKILHFIAKQKTARIIELPENQHDAEDEEFLPVENWDELNAQCLKETGMNLTAFRAKVRVAEEQVKNGLFYTREEALKHFEKWKEKKGIS